ncbi:hypothetical protein [Methylobacterium sp. P5_C11]
MDLTHVRACAAALAAKDRDAVRAQMAEAVVLNTPLAAEPVRGKAAIRPVVDALLAAVEAFADPPDPGRPRTCRRRLRRAPTGSTAWMTGASTRPGAATR